MNQWIPSITSRRWFQSSNAFNPWSLSNQTSNVLHLDCIEGFDGGLPQIFEMVYFLHTHQEPGNQLVFQVSSSLAYHVHCVWNHLQTCLSHLSTTQGGGDATRCVWLCHLQTCSLVYVKTRALNGRKVLDDGNFQPECF